MKKLRGHIEEDFKEIKNSQIFWIITLVSISLFTVLISFWIVILLLFLASLKCIADLDDDKYYIWHYCTPVIWLGFILFLLLEIKDWSYEKIKQLNKYLDNV